MTESGVLFLAVVDSINPSAILVTLLLLSTSASRARVQVPVYVAAIFTTYLSLGVAMLLGLESLLPALDERVGFAIQTLLGAALLGYAFTAHRRAAPATTPAAPQSVAAVALLGVTVTVMELPTAAPYLGAVALITEASWPMSAWLPLLVLYNVIFVMPPLALFTGHLVMRERLAGTYAALAQRIERGAKGAAVWIAGLIGGALAFTGLIELVARMR